MERKGAHKSDQVWNKFQDIVQDYRKKQYWPQEHLWFPDVLKKLNQDSFQLEAAKRKKFQWKPYEKHICNYPPRFDTLTEEIKELNIPEFQDGWNFEYTRQISPQASVNHNIKIGGTAGMMPDEWFGYHLGIVYYAQNYLLMSRWDPSGAVFGTMILPQIKYGPLPAMNVTIQGQSMRNPLHRNISVEVEMEGDDWTFQVHYIPSTWSFSYAQEISSSLSGLTDLYLNPGEYSSMCSLGLRYDRVDDSKAPYIKPSNWSVSASWSPMGIFGLGFAKPLFFREKQKAYTRTGRGPARYGMWGAADFTLARNPETDVYDSTSSMGITTSSLSNLAKWSLNSHGILKSYFEEMFYNTFKWMYSFEFDMESFAMRFGGGISWTN